MKPKIKMYGLSSCAHCKDMRMYLKERGADFEWTYLDLLTGDERSNTMRELRKHNPECTFPTIVIGDTVIAGFKKDKIDACLDDAPDHP